MPSTNFKNNESKTLVVVGSGPGIGVTTASQFAIRGFNNIVLISRNAERLGSDAKSVGDTAQSKATIQTYTADVADHVGLKKTLDQVYERFGTPEVVLYNAARVAESKIGEDDPDVLISDFKIINVGCYATAIWALPLLASRAKTQSGSRPSFLITGGLLYEHPDPEHFILSMQKAAQVNFAGSLRQTAGPQGIHVATVVVGGVVSDNDPVINAKNIAGKFWALYEEPEESWSSMVHVGGK